MKLVADLHIHSRFSRATSRNLDFIALHRGALQKGIHLLGTGDFTHPGWMNEIETQLEEAEEGLFRLRPQFCKAAEEGLPAACTGDVRFVLQVEISNIYKKDDRTRKNHNLVYVPSLEAAGKVTTALSSIGNVASDGRPILGLDARDLLEITLESDPLSFLIPAHIWTPWFSMLGSRSGFDSLQDCFGDLSDHIFAAETGLSSDPAMNWRLSALDNLTLVSNSDAHSAAKLGREANLLDIEPGFVPLRRALEHREGFSGTLEFYPDEGKYHLDGHRKCNVRLSPFETRANGGLCPVCGKPVTVGVMSRVQDLADRPDDYRPADAPQFESIVPLPEVVGEVLGVGSGSNRVRLLVDQLLHRLGPELEVLRQIPLEEIGAVGGEVLREGIRRVRCGEVKIDGGYDGEFGTIRIFEPHERDHLQGQMAIFKGLAPAQKKRAERLPREKIKRDVTGADLFTFVEMESLKKQDRQRVLGDFMNDPLYGLDEHQQQAARIEQGPLLVVAGPGTGKTRTLVCRVAHQIKTGAVKPEEVLAITFTNQAALELSERIRRELPSDMADQPRITTFHGFGRDILMEFGSSELPRVASTDERVALITAAIKSESSVGDAEDILARISLAKQSPDPSLVIGHDDEMQEIFRRYQEGLRSAGIMDIDDLVLEALQLLKSDPALCAYLQTRHRSISVDEYQDVNDVQAELVQHIAGDGRSLLAIGDPDQSIYGFRGARPGHFLRFAARFPGASTVSLRTTYRLTDHIAAVAGAVLQGRTSLAVRKAGVKVELVACPTVASEAEQILVRLERLIGGTSHFAIDSGRADNSDAGDFGFGDVAILTRTRQQRREIIDALSRSGVPCMAVGEEEPHDPRAQKVAVMTMHASKGREFDVVFVAGVEPGLMPLHIGDLKADEAEERRLLYVAVTRARRLLVISYAQKRILFGQTMPAGPSPFVRELPPSSVSFVQPDLPKQRPRITQLPLF